LFSLAVYSGHGQIRRAGPGTPHRRLFQLRSGAGGARLDGHDGHRIRPTAAAAAAQPASH